VVLYQLFVQTEPPSLAMMLLPIYATLATLVFVHILIAFALPVRWSSIREQFRTRLVGKLHGELTRAFVPIPDDIATAIREEKRQIESLVSETKQIADWVNEREQASHVADLYGK
jgi:hypothetical protein